MRQHFCGLRNRSEHQSIPYCRIISAYRVRRDADVSLRCSGIPGAQMVAMDLREIFVSNSPSNGSLAGPAVLTNPLMSWPLLRCPAAVHDQA